MDQADLITNENNVFNRQQSIYDNSTTYTNNNEAIIVVWLRTTSTSTNINFDSLESKIENTADLLKPFNDLPSECEEYIRATPKNVKIFFILSSKYVQTLLENIHDLQVLHSVYIYDETSNREKVNDYSKVVSVYTDLNILTDELSAAVYQYIRHSQLPMTIFKQQYEQGQSTNLLNKFAYFVDFWNPLFIDLLFDLPQIDYNQQKATFIKQCRIYYRVDESVLRVIDEFESTYKSEECIFWYKRDSFVFRLLNKVMRQQNIQGILQFRFFILDLFKELNKIYHEFINSNFYEDNSDDYVYRGQRMFVNELDNLKINLKQGTVISINSFFSASRDEVVALGFSGAIKLDNVTATLSQDIKSVLFQIKIPIDYKMKLKRKPFADVSFILNNGKRDKPHELEVIFMVGSFFQIDEIVENKETEVRIKDKKVKAIVTLVKLTLINEDDLSIPIMKDYQILKSTKTIEGKLIRIGNLLIDHSLSIQSARSKADSYYKVLFNEIKATACLTGQAWVELKRGQYDLGIELAIKALSTDSAPNDELKITTLNCLGGIYSKLKNYPEALKYYLAAYDLSKPTDDKIARNTYLGPCIPIDKYAMYDNYRNISSINIARIYQKRGDIQLAWDMYKFAVDCEMRDTSNFHCHTCMTIAESGTHEMITTPEEHNRIWKNWKSFLDLGLVDILKYRTPVVTGYLSLSHQYDFPSRRYNNTYCRTMAIDYFRNVENHCTPYVSNHQYYLYTLQCYERLAELYPHWNYRSIDYYEKMIRLCFKYHPDDLENIIIGYKGLKKTYQQQQLNRQNNSENISMLLCANNTEVTQFETPMTPPVTPMTPPVTPLIPQTLGSLFQNIKPLHFAFGCYDKYIDPRLKNEADLRKKIIYCHMKLAAFYYDQEKTDDAKHLLIEAILLCRQYGPEMREISRICNENLLILTEDFESVIQSYKNRAPEINNIIGDCTNEDNYTYIAQLYKKKNDLNAMLEFLQKPIQYFEQYDYVCLHTIDCYIKLAEHYRTINKDLTINTYERAIHLVKKHRPNTMITTISIIEEHLISYFKQVNDLDTTITIYKALCGIVQYETTDISILYNHLKRVLKLLVHKHDAFNAILNTYSAFIDLMLQIINPLTSQMTMVLFHFRDHSISAYRKSNELLSAIEIYQKLICLLFKHQIDMKKIKDEYRIIAVGFTTKHFLEDSVKAYENLLDFVCQHPTTGRFIEDDLINDIFYIWKQQIVNQYLLKKNFSSAISLHYKMIHFLETYGRNINVDYNLDEFVSKTLKNYDEIAKIYQLENNNLDQTMNVYQEQIEFLIKYQIGSIHEHIKTIFLKCQQFATDHEEQAIELYRKLVTFIEGNRLQYLADLSVAYGELAQLRRSGDEKHQCLCSTEKMTTVSNSYRIADLKQRIFDYKQKAKIYSDNNQFDKAITVYRNELLPFLLENHARDDEQIATCYRKMASVYYEQNEANAHEALDYYQKVIDIYESQEDDFYTDYAFQLNPNVCRRYAETLFMCYKSMKTIYITSKDQNSTEICDQKMVSIYEKHKDQFQSIVDPVTNVATIEIRLFVPLGY